MLGVVVNIAKPDEYYEFLPTAKEISPDPDDVDFFALALKLNCPLWSEDKRWKQQSEIEVSDTTELLELLERIGLISA